MMKEIIKYKTNRMLIDSNRMLVGWKEWCSLPELNLPAIKAKIDTGAKTSALHATGIEPLTIEGQRYVKFQVDPIQGKPEIQKQCLGLLVDRRYVMNSGGHREMRYIIKTPIQIGALTWDIEITLTDRELLSYRMLIGREALRERAIIDPTRSHCQGRISRVALNKFYKKLSTEISSLTKGLF